MRRMLQFLCEWKKAFFLCLKLMASQPSATSSEVNERPLETPLYLSLQADFQRMPITKSEVEVVRTRITLECTECKNRNYNMTKDKKTHPERMETKKYCKFCRSHTLHKETK